MQKVPVIANDTNRKCSLSKLHTYFTGFLVLYIGTSNLSFRTHDYNYHNSASTSPSSSSLVSSSSSTTTTQKKKTITNTTTFKNDTISDQLREEEEDDTVIATTTIDEKVQVVQPQQQRLGDGCYHVFIDVGANIGVHGRFLYEPEKYPDSWYAVQLFEQEYGTNRTNSDYCVFAIEANPSHWTRLDTVSQSYGQEKNWSYTIIKAGVSDQNNGTTMTFYKQGGRDIVHNDWGFSNVHDYRNQTTEVNNPLDSIITVPAIRLSDWIQYHILQRQIPNVPSSYVQQQGKQQQQPQQQQDDDAAVELPPPSKPKLGMKMDIEGSEYTVLPDLIHTGTACTFDFIFGEFHSKFGEGFGRFEQVDGHRIPLNSTKELQEYEWALKTTMHASRNCPIKWLSIDDESYLHDGQPLPGDDDDDEEKMKEEDNDNVNNNNIDKDAETETEDITVEVKQEEEAILAGKLSTMVVNHDDEEEVDKKQQRLQRQQNHGVDVSSSLVSLSNDTMSHNYTDNNTRQ